MIEVVVLHEGPPFGDEYEAMLVGWVVYEGRVMALVVTHHLDVPWMIHQSRIKVKV